jgi:hypothetical protein
MNKTASNIQEVVIADLPEATTTSKLFLAHLAVDTKSSWASPPKKRTDCACMFNYDRSNLLATPST